MPDTDRDELLADLIADLLRRADEGESVDVTAAAEAHPELGTELRELWHIAAMANFLGETLDRPEGGSTDLGRPARGKGVPPITASPSRLAAEPIAGGRIFGDYELLEQVGEGGMGVVYRAQHRTLGRLVALKMVRKGALATESELARFRAEAAASARLDHPQVIPIYEVGEIDGQPYFTMKFVQGVTLAHRLAAGPLPAREAARLMLGVARAIAYTHANGIVHRDLKPSNILIDGEGRAHVGDFGLAKRVTISGSQPVAAPSVEAALDDAGQADVRRALQRLVPDQAWGSGDGELQTRTGVIMGTPSFMSPEQAAGRRSLVGPASDIYSLGGILYQCLTGRPPFVAASPAELLLLVLEQEPVPPRAMNPSADADLEMVTLKCLQKPPELRYHSATELADDLDAWLSNEPISARSTSIVQLMSRLFRETHHAVVLQNWGLLWMLHSLVLLVLCTVTNWFQFIPITSRLPYLALWILGLGAWASIFWTLRRRAGPITFVERQIAHIWGGSMFASSLLFAVETQLGMQVLNLSPVLPLIGATVFVVKAGTLSGAFYMQAVALFATAIAMGAIRQLGLPDFGLTLYGIVSAACFLVPGWKYWKQARQERRIATRLNQPQANGSA